MRDIWTEQRKLEIWLKIELLATEALVEQGLVPLRDFRKMKKGAAFSIDRCKELERTLNHDVIAFTTNVAENINDKASRWLHYGLTSSDLIDTAFAVQMVESVDILHQDVIQLRKVIARKAKKHAFTPMIGRSHGIHAEPTTFGLKMALMFDEFGRAERRLKDIRKQVAVGRAHIGSPSDRCCRRRTRRVECSNRIGQNRSCRHPLRKEPSNRRAIQHGQANSRQGGVQ